VNNKVSYTALNEAVRAKEKFNKEWLKMVKILAS
jgi:6-phosphofructokinase 1